MVACESMCESFVRSQVPLCECLAYSRSISAAAYGSESVHREQTSLYDVACIALVSATAGGIPRSRTISRPCHAKTGVRLQGRRCAQFNLEMLCRQRLNYAEKVIRVKGCDYGAVRGP